MGLTNSEKQRIRQQQEYRRLLEKCQCALDQLPKTRINQLNSDTYTLASRVEKILEVDNSITVVPFLVTSVLQKCLLAFSEIPDTKIARLGESTFALSAQIHSALSQISTPFILLEACRSALALINISTEYAGMSTAQELEAAITRAESELFA